MELVICVNSAFNFKVLCVHPSGTSRPPKYIPGVLSQHMLYFAKYIPNTEYMTVMDLTDLFKINSWKVAENISYENARLLHPMLPIICDECEFNKCVHIFPEIVNAAAVIETFKNLYSTVNIRYLCNSAVNIKKIACIESNLATIDEIRARITQVLKTHHYYYARHVDIYLDENATNEELDAHIESVQSSWFLGDTVSRKDLYTYEPFVICMRCKTHEVACEHIFPEKRNPVICAVAFKKEIDIAAERAKTIVERLRADSNFCLIWSKVKPHIAKLNLDCDTVDDPAVKKLLTELKFNNLGTYLNDTINSKEMCVCGSGRAGNFVYFSMQFLAAI